MQPSKLGPTRIPRRRKPPGSNREDVNEPARLVDEEPVDIEHEVPAEDNVPEQRVDPDDKALPPFEE